MKYTVWIKPGRVPVEIEAASAFDAKCAVVHCLQDVTTCDVEAMPAVERRIDHYGAFDVAATNGGTEREAKR